MCNFKGQRSAASTKTAEDLDPPIVWFAPVSFLTRQGGPLSAVKVQHWVATTTAGEQVGDRCTLMMIATGRLSHRLPRERGDAIHETCAARGCWNTACVRGLDQDPGAIANMSASLRTSSSDGVARARCHLQRLSAASRAGGVRLRLAPVETLPL
jgi:hypothetical protein